MTATRPLVRPVRARLRGLLAMVATILVVTALPGAAPVSAGGTQDFVQLELGNSFACARRADLSVWCWGRNDRRQLNDGTTTQRRTPVRARVSQVVDIAVGDSHVCALRVDDRVWCWGRNASGELGDGTTFPRTRERLALLPETDWVDISAGGGTTCARMASKHTYCWGQDSSGQVGDGPNPVYPPQTSVTTPVLINTSDVVSPGWNHTCSATFGGNTRCWGRNNDWQLGDGTTTLRWTPERVDWPVVMEDVRFVDTGDGFTCVRKVDYTVWCWGDNREGRLGRGTYNGEEPDPAEIVGLDDVRQLSLNGSHACATNAARKAYCWGNNSHKQLGVVNYDDTPDHRQRPTRVPGLSDVVEIDVGVARDGSSPSASGFTCARKLDRSIWCWGRNDRGQLGDGTTTDRRVPRKISFP